MRTNPRANSCLKEADNYVCEGARARYDRISDFDAWVWTDPRIAPIRHVCRPRTTTSTDNLHRFFSTEYRFQLNTY